ncbi:sodium:proton antiporter [Candidatus Endobugula sertula]|uniref:Sodium:proton antiporter n=1 Tax=Candidatus Endobugula sertula TaxID=62101 RepID=A0A1D2QMR0_9GAMM|nr:sodium:proton antiporter [Candidatus Endobugula sertula]
MSNLVLTIITLLLTTLFSSFTLASGATGETLNLTSSTTGFICLAIFIIAYSLVIGEEYLHLRKSKPVLLAAGLIWIIIAIVYQEHGNSQLVENALRHNLLEYVELLLFLLVAMTYIAALEERRLFDWLRVWLVNKGMNFKQLFWVTGVLAFFISPIADNLTTALVMCAVILAVAGDNKSFVSISCINIVVAANAGGAFSPFGDITTLMVWQKGLVESTQFFSLFLPSVINFLIPATIMSFFIDNDTPKLQDSDVEMKRGAIRIVFLFLATVLTAILCHGFLHLPPVFGMMTGLAYLQFFGYYLKKSLPKSLSKKRQAFSNDPEKLSRLDGIAPFDVFTHIQRAEWDTLMFFYGVVMCVGGLGFLGYLGMISEVMYTQWNPLYANIMVGVLSAIVDNIPVMFAVLSMEPDMNLGQWLLVTLTAGVGGSLLSVGSAAGVALMGQAAGKYTFFGHLKWAPVIALGYTASILCHLWINSALFA